MGKMTILGLILYTLMPFGQMWTRIFDYDGSVDMWWFFIPFFMIPPLQFIPILMLYLGYIKPGKGGKVYDAFVWLPVVVKFIVRFFGEMLLPRNYAHILGEIIMIMTIILTKYLHTSNSCKTINKELTVTGSKFGDFFMDAIYENGMAGIFGTIVNYLPIIGWVISLLSLIGPLNNIKISLLYLIGYTFIYTIQNMFEQTDMSSLCNLTSIPATSYVKLVFGLILSLMTYLNDSF